MRSRRAAPTRASLLRVAMSADHPEDELPLAALPDAAKWVRGLMALGKEAPRASQPIEQCPAPRQVDFVPAARTRPIPILPPKRLASRQFHGHIMWHNRPSTCLAAQMASLHCP